jgi:Ca2+-binding RTX toxin-like protein
MANVTAQEQLMLELINRARLNPAGEAMRLGIGLNDGLAPGTISAAAKQPLAMNDLLANASRAYSTRMLNEDFFAHVAPDGSEPGGRMRAAGYVFSGSWTWGENISWRGTSPGLIDLSAALPLQHDGLFRSAAHRENILSGSFREIGVGQVRGNYLSGGTDWSASMITQSFAVSGTSLFITGVVYNDVVDDNFYGIGEGQGGVPIQAAGAIGLASSASGGYEVAVSPGAVTITLGPVAVTLGMSNSNVKIDLVNSSEIWTSASLSSISGASVIGLLGIEAIGATGGAFAERMIGNVAANALNGGGGDDTLEGGAGADNLNGGPGFDFASFLSSARGVTARLDAPSLNTGDAIGDSYASIEGLIGSQFNDFLVGSDISGEYMTAQDGDDFVAGRGGNDTILGDGGADQFWGGEGADRLDGGAGYDIARYDFAATGVLARLDGGANTGEALGDTFVGVEALYGSAFGDVLVGNQASNVLVGLDGGDHLYGVGGDDILMGGAGGDVFAFNGTSFGTDTVLDFATTATAGTNHDWLDFRGLGSFSSWSIIQVSANTHIVTNHGTVILQGISASTLVAGDFLF